MNLVKLAPQLTLKKTRFKPYSYVLQKDDTSYHIIVLNTSKRHLLTINSKLIWELKYGKPDGSRFQTTSSKLLSMKEFMKCPNKIVICKSEPYKVLQYINESDVIDISDKDSLFDVAIYHSIDEFIQAYK